jgi:hypothetical protein
MMVLAGMSGETGGKAVAVGRNCKRMADTLKCHKAHLADSASIAKGLARQTRISRTRVPRQHGAILPLLW